MTQQLFSIFDLAAGAHITPFFLPNQAMALRSFKDAINDPNHAFSKNPGDYALLHLATFDDETGALDVPDVPITLATGLPLVLKKDEK